MMYGNWFSNGYCPLYGRYVAFSFWHILFIIGVITIIASIIIVKSRSKKSDDLIELLKIQLIEGKITEEEYLNRKNVIERK